MATTNTTNLSPLSSSLNKPYSLSKPKPSSLFPKPLLHPSHSKTYKTLFSTFSKSPISDLISTHKPNPDPHSLTFDNDDKPREECGVGGTYGDPKASRLCYLSLHALQHRGQEGAAIVSVHQNILKSITGVGLVSEVFTQSKLNQLPGDPAIGHVRYSTAGSSMLKNVQPFVAGYRFGSVGVAYNGNLVNYQTLRANLEDNGSIFNTSSDTEVVLHLIAISKARPFFLGLLRLVRSLKGLIQWFF
ncbi:hypothetical protein LOK49_LG03G03670 [Camellia lanceoleosa]|uniref:Uncharacterized protein n=1 Tax=Camellia lanceoleosa TaxID=1840588 RepID=A0ACC0I843_9ERIC|nr:hypothetical protein LOK49_LG03G03670 [Camellia lanceoleosa]